MMFFTMYDVIERRRDWDEEVSTDPGERYQVNYHPVYDEKGIWHLEEDEKKIDTYLDIQSHAESVDLKVLLARYRNGEVDILDQVQGWYGDITDMPTNYAELLNTVMSGQQVFDKLDPEVKSKFDNNFVQFMQSAGSEDWFNKLGLVSESKDEPAVKEEE